MKEEAESRIILVQLTHIVEKPSLDCAMPNGVKVFFKVQLQDHNLPLGMMTLV
jgi:hypothetical protein